MKKLGVFVGEKGNWSFFKEIFDDLSTHYRSYVFKEKVYRTPLLHGRLNRFAFREGIRSILRRSDICIFEWASELLVPASHMPKHCPIVVRLHSYELYAWAPHVNWYNVDKVILVSRAMQQKFNDLYPDHAHKTEVIYNGRSLAEFNPVPRPFNLDLGMLCSIHPRKRLYEIILMLFALRGQGYDAHLHVGGGRVHGPDMDEYYVACHRLLERLDLEDSVTFYGHVTNPAVWLRDNVDMFISNSYWEGNQVALVEAMATGCYCLSHFWDGAEEILPQENLYATEAELLEKIIGYCNQPDEERRRRQAQMRAIACEKFDIERAKSRIRAIINEAFNGLVAGAGAT